MQREIAADVDRARGKGEECCKLPVGSGGAVAGCESAKGHERTSGNPVDFYGLFTEAQRGHVAKILLCDGHG